MAPKTGVFIRSAESDDAIIEACKNLIRSTKSRGQITAMRRDKTNGGVKMYFNNEVVVQEFLDKQFLGETGEDLTCRMDVYPLVTYLTVHEAILPMEDEEFTQKLREVMRTALGTEPDVSKILLHSEKYPGIGTGNWRVIVDIPEVEDLDVYKSIGLPDNFVIQVPGMLESLSVTFYCRRCENDGHTQWRCPRRIAIETKPDLQSVKDKESPVEIGKNNPVLNLKNIREFESEIGKEQVLSFHLTDGNCIKKELGKLISSNCNPAPTRSLSFADDETNVSLSKKARISPTSGDESRAENLSKASSTTNDEELVEIIYESTPSTSLSNPLSKVHRSSPSSTVRGPLTTTKNAADDSVSTSNQPAPTIKSELHYDSDSSQGPFASASMPGRQRKKPTQVASIVIPDRIKTIISEMKDGVLDVDVLQAFLTHVKKKSKPRDVAKIFTDNVDGLKQQLENIRKRFYLTALRASNEEGPFMKWFDSTLQRFDGTPSTRKRKSTTSADASA